MADTIADKSESIRRAHARVQEAVEEALRRSGRPSGAVRVVVVTKSQPLAVVEAALQAGLRILGENYAEEAIGKMRALQQRLAVVPSEAAPVSIGAQSAAGVEWHMIGHIQSRKAKLVAEHFDFVHSVDSVKLAERLDGFAQESGRQVPALLEFNVGGEVEKQGWTASDESAWPQLLGDVEAIARLQHLRVHGIMTMPPLSIKPEDARPYFRRLRRLRDFLAGQLPNIAWRELSMGTSGDYPVAVEEGATLVRVGEAILGSRSKPERQ
jgi:pyridoxal phosphate enzyme (YggS family)